MKSYSFQINVADNATAEDVAQMFEKYGEIVVDCLRCDGDMDIDEQIEFDNDGSFFRTE